MISLEKNLENQLEKKADGTLGAFSQEVSAQRVNRVESMGVDSLLNHQAAVNKAGASKNSK